MIYNGKQLEDGTLLSLAGVQDESTLYVLGRLLGGMAKKRKKKTYTKPKKQKHKHKPKQKSKQKRKSKQRITSSSTCESVATAGTSPVD